jgi:hypothetical protein
MTMEILSLKNLDMKLIIPTCDKYRNLLEANKYTLDKFAGKELKVTVLGYKEPDFDLGSWTFFKLGEDGGPQTFANNFYKFFDTLDDEYFIYGNDDSVLTKAFNFGFLNEIVDVIDNMPMFGRIWLTKTPPSIYGGISRVVRDFGEYQIGEIHQYSEFRLSLQCSLWKTSYFKKYLASNLTPWQFELRGDAKNDGHAILIPINNSVIGIGHVMKSYGVEVPGILDGWNCGIYGDGQLSEDDSNYITNILKKHEYVKK